MATGMGVRSPGSDVSSLNLKETELTLGLPGGESRSEKKSGKKRGLSERVDLNVESSGGGESQVIICLDDDLCGEEISVASTSPEPKARRVIGWPPLKSTRKNMVMMMKACKYVKVAVDGAPYLRKVDLEMYNTYQQLLTSLDQMFSCFTIRNYLNERKLMDPVNRSEYVPTYQDKDGDWMLVGDVPWKMFVESCKRLRLMKSSEAIGLAPGIHSKCNSSGRQLNKELRAIGTDKVPQHQSRLSTSRVNKGYRYTSTLK